MLKRKYEIVSPSEEPALKDKWTNNLLCLICQEETGGSIVSLFKSAVFKATWKNVIQNNSYKSKAVPSSQKTPSHPSRQILHKRCENTRFHWPVFSRMGRIRVIENPYSRIFYVVRVQKFETPKNLESEFILNKANTHKTTINTSWNGY